MKDARGRGPLRGQGPEPAQPRPELLAEAERRPARSTGSGASIDRVADVEYTLTDSVSEALLLEANLIKRFQPRFNVRLKDDKSYPYIKITLADDFPRVERTRKLVNDGSRYFGPYASASSVDESMNLIRRLFPFRTCTIEIKEGKRALPAALPALPHQALPGPVHRGDLEGGLRPRHRPDRAVPRGSPGGPRGRPDGRDGGRLGADRVRAGGRPSGQGPRDRADDGEPEDGRLRQHQARPHRRRPPGQPGRRPAVRGSRRGNDRTRRVPARGAPRRRRRARSWSASCASSTPGRPRSRPRSWSGAARRRRRPGGVPGRAPRRSRPPPSTPAGREAPAAWSWPSATRPRPSPASRSAGWPTRARPWAP